MKFFFALFLLLSFNSQALASWQCSDLFLARPIANPFEKTVSNGYEPAIRQCEATCYFESSSAKSFRVEAMALERMRPESYFL